MIQPYKTFMTHVPCCARRTRGFTLVTRRQPLPTMRMWYRRTKEQSPKTPSGRRGRKRWLFVLLRWRSFARLTLKRRCLFCLKRSIALTFWRTRKPSTPDLVRRDALVKVGDWLEASRVAQRHRETSLPAQRTPQVVREPLTAAVLPPHAHTPLSIKRIDTSDALPLRSRLADLHRFFLFIGD